MKLSELIPKLKKNWWLIGLLIISTLLVVIFLINKPHPETVKEEEKIINEIAPQTTASPSSSITPSPLPTTIPSETPKPTIGTGKIYMEGQTTNFSINIPVKGGAISGTANGFCNGSISGAFDSSTNFVHGELSGVCGGINSSGSFTGEITLSSSSGAGTFSGTGSGISKSGNWVLKI